MTNRLSMSIPVASVADDRSRLRVLRARLERLGRRRLLVGLDLAAVLVVAATFAQLGPPELLFHVVFVILTAEAFVFGRRICLQRIAAVSIALVLYACLPALGFGTEPLELTEWPLMFTIAVLVAWMADREQSVGRRYAGLYREARDRLVRAQEQERGRVARDLHDGIGQTMTALGLTLDAAALATTPDQAARDLDHARGLVREAIDGTRVIAEGIRPPRMAERGLASALRSMGSWPGDLVRVEIGPAADIRLGEAGTEPETEIEAFRIAQEAVRNAMNHAQAQRIDVRLERTRDGLRLEVADDGIGFDQAAVHPRRLGIIGMRERADAIGADLDIRSAAGSGTRVRLSIPVDPAPTPVSSLAPLGPSTDDGVV